MLQRISQVARGEPAGDQATPFAALFAAAVAGEAGTKLAGQSAPETVDGVSEGLGRREDPPQPDAAAVQPVVPLVAAPTPSSASAAGGEERTAAPIGSLPPTPTLPGLLEPVAPGKEAAALARTIAAAEPVGRGPSTPGAALVASPPPVETSHHQTPTTPETLPGLPPRSEQIRGPSVSESEPAPLASFRLQGEKADLSPDGAAEVVQAVEVAKQRSDPQRAVDQARAPAGIDPGRMPPSGVASQEESTAPLQFAGSELAKPEALPAERPPMPQLREASGGGVSPATEEPRLEPRSERAHPSLSGLASGAAASTTASSVAIATDGGIAGVVAVSAAGTPHAAAAGPQTTSNGPAVPVEAVAVEIATRAGEGHRRFEIRLDPPELGRIDVRLDFARDGQLLARLVVDRAETLDLLRRDSVSLERALESAGLRTEDSGLQFSLRQQSAGQEHTRGEQPRPDLLIVPDEDLAVREAVQRAYGVLRGLGRGVDIRI